MNIIDSELVDSHQKLTASPKVVYVRAINFFLVPLMLLSAILAETIFEELQIVSELLLMFIFTILLAKGKFNKKELALLLVFIVSQIGSFFVNNISTWMLDGKLLGLAVLAIIYFRRHATDSFFVHTAFILCVLLIVIQRALGYFPLPISQFMTTLAGELSGRPLGLFLNYHYTTFFSATYFLGYTLKRKVFPFDYIIIASTGVMTSLVSYIGQKSFNLIKPGLKLHSLKSQLLVFIGGVFLITLLFQFSIFILEKFNIQSASGLVVLYQIIDFDTYTRMLTVFPVDIYGFYQNNLYDYSDLNIEGFGEHGNEMFLVTLFVQAGALLAIAFLLFLLWSVPNSRIFILLSLLHYSYLLSPFIIYVICMFENMNKKVLGST